MNDPADPADDSASGAIVLVPIKGFHSAKRRLAPVLNDPQRAELARTLAEGVLMAASPMRVTVVCDDSEVADWARERGAAVASTPGLDLNQSLTTALDRVAGAGVGRAIIAHSDLPFARELTKFATAEPDEVLICADRHGRGTNVMSLPVEAGKGAILNLSYGPDSFPAHCAAARELGLVVTVVEDEALAWDVDDPADLDPPPHLGRFTVPGTSASATVDAP